MKECNPPTGFMTILCKVCPWEVLVLYTVQKISADSNGSVIKQAQIVESQYPVEI